MQAGKQEFLDARREQLPEGHGRVRPVSRRRLRRRRKRPPGLHRSPAGLRDLLLGRVDAQLRDARQDLRQSRLGRPLRGSRLQFAARRPVDARPEGAALPHRRQHGRCATARTRRPGIQNGGNMLAYSPWDFRCCQHNVSHGWPYLRRGTVARHGRPRAVRLAVRRLGRDGQGRPGRGHDRRQSPTPPTIPSATPSS